VAGLLPLARHSETFCRVVLRCLDVSPEASSQGMDIGNSEVCRTQTLVWIGRESWFSQDYLDSFVLDYLILPLAWMEVGINIPAD
jgi:hypothetical protein